MKKFLSKIRDLVSSVIDLERLRKSSEFLRRPSLERSRDMSASALIKRLIPAGLTPFMLEVLTGVFPKHFPLRFNDLFIPGGEYVILVFRPLISAFAIAALFELYSRFVVKCDLLSAKVIFRHLLRYYAIMMPIGMFFFFLAMNRIFVGGSTTAGASLLEIGGFAFLFFSLSFWLVMVPLWRALKPKRWSTAHGVAALALIVVGLNLGNSVRLDFAMDHTGLTRKLEQSPYLESQRRTCRELKTLSCLVLDSGGWP